MKRNITLTNPSGKKDVMVSGKLMTLRYSCINFYSAKTNTGFILYSF